MPLAQPRTRSKHRSRARRRAPRSGGPPRRRLRQLL